jgi:hypothetical protein
VTVNGIEEQDDLPGSKVVVVLVEVVVVVDVVVVEVVVVVVVDVVVVVVVVQFKCKECIAISIISATVIPDVIPTQS